MLKPILNIDEVNLSPRPRGFLPKGDLAIRFEARTGRVADVLTSLLGAV